MYGWTQEAQGSPSRDTYSVVGTYLRRHRQKRRVIRFRIQGKGTADLSLR